MRVIDLSLPGFEIISSNKKKNKKKGEEKEIRLYAINCIKWTNLVKNKSHETICIWCYLPLADFLPCESRKKGNV